MRRKQLPLRCSGNLQVLTLHHQVFVYIAVALAENVLMGTGHGMDYCTAFHVAGHGMDYCTAFHVAAFMYQSKE